MLTTDDKDRLEKVRILIDLIEQKFYEATVSTSDMKLGKTTNDLAMKLTRLKIELEELLR